MHPWPAGTASSPHPHRSWTDHHVPPSTGPKNSPYAHGPRSASFSASRPSIPTWNDLPPPPVPPRPAVLFPGFNSPALAHSDRDLFFGQPPPQQTKPSPLNAERFQRSGYLLNNAVPWPHPNWSPEQGSSTDPVAAPVLPPRPLYLNDHAYSAQSESNGRLYSHAQHFYQVSTPPPAVPPRPMTADDDMRIQSSASAPVVPPKPLALASPSGPSPPNAVEWLSNKIVTPTDQRHPPIPSETAEPAGNLSLVPNPQPENSKRTSGHSRTHSADDVARAMELSLAESQSRRSDGRNLQEEEDHELQRVLADSLAMSRLQSRPSLENFVPQVGESSSTRLTSSLEQAFTVEEISPVSGAAERQAETEAKRLQRERDSKAAIRKLMEQEERRLAQEKRDFEQRDEELARQQAEEEERAQRMEREAQERRDVELARRLASANEAGPSRPRNPVSTSAPVHIIKANPVPNSARLPTSKSVPPPETNTIRPALRPPQYDDIITTAPMISLKQHARPRLSNTSIQSTSQFNESASNNIRGRTASAIATPLQDRAQFPRASSVGATSVSKADEQGSLSNESSGETSRQDPLLDQSHVAGHSKTPETAAAATLVDRPGLPLHEPAPTVNNNRSSNTSIIPASHGGSAERELLKGVSYGFEPPKTPSTPVELPECSPFPEVISLYPAPAPSFHIMALSWRHMMRLLAQFETRIEPSVNTIAQSKNESVLRVAIQFLKLPYTTNEWRTVIHLSIDQPIPPNVPQTFRFTNGDTTVLPYSFALGETPPHLRLSAISHLYAVPLSQTTPFPILPLALPNLALYLQSAMRDSRSRKVQHDTSNTMRRLARIVNTCYPEEIPTAEAEERESGRGMGGLFKRVVGRGGAKRRDTQGNEDVYDMVTPFRIDKYTAVSGT